MRSSRLKFVVCPLLALFALQSVAITRRAEAAEPTPASSATPAEAAPAATTTAPAPATTSASPSASPPGHDPVEPALGTYWTPRRIVGFMLLGSGVVGLGVGGGVGLQAKSRFDTASNEAGEIRNTDSAHAVREGNIATGMLIAGGVLAAGGLVLWLTAPSAAPQVGTNGSSVFVRGSF